LKNLYWNTVSPLLEKILRDLMKEELFSPFRLVGGTALSLQIGHRMSVDIDLFTDAYYDSIDFEEIKNFIEYKYNYCSYRNIERVGMGTYFEVGNSKIDCVKIDLFYTDNFIFDEIIIDNVRMASEKEIIAMKLDVVLRNGRKKDFWDLHYYLDKISIDEMISFFVLRYPYDDSFYRLKSQFMNFENADLDTEPNCLLNKEWEIIKLDFVEKLS
jgi:predicted nucleotidyltransferase component of viral defense system